MSMRQDLCARRIASDLLRDKSRSKKAMTESGRALSQPAKHLRKKPYTEIGIRRLTCHRKGCENMASRQWQICSDGNTYRPICDVCDVELNKLVIEFMGFDDKEEIIKRYRENSMEVER